MFQAFQPDAGGATLKELTQRDSKYVAPRRNGQGGRFQTDEVRQRNIFLPHLGIFLT